jgi:hypothetical protein
LTVTASPPHILPPLAVPELHDARFDHLKSAQKAVSTKKRTQTHAHMPEYREEAKAGLNDESCTKRGDRHTVE